MPMVASKMCTEDFLSLLCLFSSVAVQTQKVQHYDQNLHGQATYPYGGLPPKTEGPDGDRILSGTPSTSVHSSPGHQPGNENAA